MKKKKNNNLGVISEYKFRKKLLMAEKECYCNGKVCIRSGFFKRINAKELNG
jgi:hypothetical protein